VPPKTRRLRGFTVLATTLVLLTAAGAFVYNSLRHVTAALPPPGCQAGTGVAAISLDPGQAAIAAIIAGVAARHKLPREAVTIAYATALQESHMENLTYGDRDSVGIFQQRPSQGWGPAADLEDPVYATTKFFGALVQVPGYTKLPVYRAAQDVQHSADGSAYEQYAEVASLLARYFTGGWPHGVSCWYTPSGQADLGSALREMAATFGPSGRAGIVVRVTTDRSAKINDGSAAVVHAQGDASWTVASWLVANAQQYGLSEVRYAGYVWNATDGSTGWQRATSAQGSPRGSIVAG
jgi:hypothetical protein